MQQGVPVYTPSWFSATGESATEEYDWGLITATPTQLSEDWGPINTNDETIPKVAENWGFLLGEFNYVQVGGQHYPNRDTFSVGESSLVVQTSGTTGVATFLLSEDLDIAAAIQYESSGITGIATYKPASTSSVQTGSVRPLNTQSSVKKVQSPLASLLLMSRSLHSFQRDLVHSSLLVVRQNPAPRHTWLETTSLFLVLRTSTSLHISLVLVLERSVKEENLIRLTLVRSIFLMMSLVEPSLLLVTPSLRRIQILTMSLLFSSVQRMKIMD